jgi:multidrug resistance efflux pump
LAAGWCAKPHVPGRNRFAQRGVLASDIQYWRDDMKTAKALLKQTQQELQNAKALLKQKTRAVANADDEHEKATAKLGRKTIKAAIKGLEQHCEILKTEAAK